MVYYINGFIVMNVCVLLLGESCQQEGTDGHMFNFYKYSTQLPPPPPCTPMPGKKYSLQCGSQTVAILTNRAKVSQLWRYLRRNIYFAMSFHTACVKYLMTDPRLWNYKAISIDLFAAHVSDPLWYQVLHHSNRCDLSFMNEQKYTLRSSMFACFNAVVE